jgi:hypothetical protein
VTEEQFLKAAYSRCIRARDAEFPGISNRGKKLVENWEIPGDKRKN